MPSIGTLIRFVIVSILAVVYWPFNVMFMYLKKHYFKWKETDKISYWLATPLYWFCFVIVFILSAPLEIMGEGLHPPLDSFR